MQTFLPVENFKESARILDYRRCGKQRVEAKQILNVLLGKAKKTKTGKVAWSNHPAVKMWKGYEEALKLYHNIMIDEWVGRGYNNSMRRFHVNRDKLVYPPFVGDEKFHAAHRSNLLRKDPEYYGQYGWKESSDLPYVWGENG